MANFLIPKEVLRKNRNVDLQQLAELENISQELEKLGAKPTSQYRLVHPFDSHIAKTGQLQPRVVISANPPKR